MVDLFTKVIGSWVFEKVLASSEMQSLEISILENSKVASLTER